MIERTSSCGNIRNLVVGVPGLSYGSDSSGSGSQSSSPSPRALRRQQSTGALHTLSKSGTVPSSSGLRRANSNPHPLLPTLSRQRQRRSSTGSFHSIGTQSQRASRRSSFESSLDCGRSTISADVGRYLSVKAARNSSRDGGEPQSSSSSRGRRSRDQQDPPALSARESKRPEPIKSLQLHPAWGRYATAQSVAELIASVPSVSIALAEARESEFEVEKKIGQGAVGEVFLARHAKSNATLALKRVNKADVFRRRKLKRVFMERAVGAAVAGCRFLCHYLYIYDTPEEVHYLTKYYRGGTLFHYLHRHGPLSMDRLRTVAAEILIAIETLHSLNFVHRDLKPENILIDEDGHVCLADFDLCERFAPLGASARSASPLITSPAGARSPTGPSERCELCGTLEYLAPEMLDGTTASAKSLDWWSLGVLMYEMAHLRTPWVFQGAKQKEVVSNILHLQVPFDERCVSIECEDLIRLLLVRDPDARVCDSKRLKKHPFFKGIRWKSLHKRKGPLADVAQNPSPVSGKQARPSCEPLEGQDLADVNQLLRAFRPWADARSHKRLIRGKSI